MFTPRKEKINRELLLKKINESLTDEELLLLEKAIKNPIIKAIALSELKKRFNRDFYIDLIPSLFKRLQF